MPPPILPGSLPLYCAQLSPDPGTRISITVMAPSLQWPALFTVPYLPASLNSVSPSSVHLTHKAVSVHQADRPSITRVNPRSAKFHRSQNYYEQAVHRFAIEHGTDSTHVTQQVLCQFFHFQHGHFRHVTPDVAPPHGVSRRSPPEMRRFHHQPTQRAPASSCRRTLMAIPAAFHLANGLSPGDVPIAFLDVYRLTATQPQWAVQ